ncbi:MAG: yvdD [Verrucomicrobiales bacterium]|nr:yvdD [Verrucomicrobiales bacterium]
MKRLCVFCGSSKGSRAVYAEAAEELGTLLARRGIELVYGGGCVGLMGIVADATLRAGGHVIGVIPQSLVIKEVVHEGLPDLRVVKSMHERKALMADLSDAFIALPGGFGTYEEFCEVLTWAQLGLHKKPFGLLNVAGFYDPLLALFDHAVAEEFIRPGHRELVLVDANAEMLLQRLETFRPPATSKWIHRDET